MSRRSLVHAVVPSPAESRVNSLGRSRVKLLGLLALSALLAATGCAHSAGQYVIARSNDLSDCVRFQTGVGAGLYAEVEASSALHPSLGFVDATLQPEYTFGWDPRPGRPPGMFRTAAFPTLVLGWPVYGYQESAQGYSDTHPYLRGFVAPFILMGTRHVERRSNSLLWLHHLVPNPRLHGSPDAEQTPASRACGMRWRACSWPAIGFPRPSLNSRTPCSWIPGRTTYGKPSFRCSSTWDGTKRHVV